MADRIKFEDKLVDAYMRYVACPSCDKGSMWSTGLGYGTAWQHKCNECKHIENYPNQYPGVIYKPREVQSEG